MTEYAALATRKVKEAGGSMTFAEYDAAMKKENYVAPINWIAGWGLSFDQWKANNDKMCAFVACHEGLLVQTETGYKIPKPISSRTFKTMYTYDADGNLIRNPGND